MKKIIAFILFFILWVPVYSQEPIKIFLPLILKTTPECDIIMNNGWSFVAPVESTNYVLNPSAETSGNYSALGAATVTRVTTYQKYGLYSFRVQTGSNGQGISLTLSALTNSVHFATFRVRGQLPVNSKMIIGTGLKSPQFIEKIDDNWKLYGASFSATESNGRTELRIIQQGNGKGDFYIDGIQVEPLAYWTSYCDGTQEGCAWNGVEHASTSTRSELSLAGGQVKDFYDDYGFLIEKVIGAGATVQSVNIDDYAILPGGELNSIKIQPRDMTIVGKFIANSELELHDKQQALHLALSSENYPGNQSFKLRFSGARVQKEIKVNYKGGLEGELGAFYCRTQLEGDAGWETLYKWIEKASIQLQAPDPYWYETGESAANLDTNDSATFRLVAGRLKSTGQWSNLGPPNAAGTYTGVYAIVEDDTYVYFGGNFLNFDNIANADYIVRYHKINGTYSALSTGLNGIVWDMTLDAAGNLILVGQFTNAGGVAAADYICKWDGVNFSNIGTPNVGAAAITAIYGVLVDKVGDIIAVGNFTDLNNTAAADYIAKYDISVSNWIAVGTPNTGAAAITSVRKAAVDSQNRLYVVGQFTSLANVTNADYIARHNGTSWEQLGLTGGAITIIYTIDISKDDLVYVGGNMTGPWGDYVSVYNGSSWSALGDGTNGTVWRLKIAPDNSVLISGLFTQAGDLTTADRFVRWNGYAFAHLDIDLPGSPVVYTIYPSKYVDPVIPQKYDLYLGFDTSGTGYFAGKVSVTNEGNALAFPQIIFKRTGGTAITIETLKNETTGKELLFDYGLLDGEKLTIDLTPTKKSIISNYFGSRLDAVLANSDFNTWTLIPGSNSVTSFCADNFALYPSSLDAFLLWRDKYKSYN